ncbi:hypothetical protein NP493_1078g02008 [Ridgeia piscesae]|uniref:Uncharacterized protein n=1 Tax=Ridgeia piscesae TaxID=27915 RepID=A0AAD9KHM6_RIDPI|nr:hypothetical protein NP493_1078g02008 [Ridgeia piscesae]
MAKAVDQSFERHLHHAEHQMRKENYDAALVYCNKALALCPKSKRCLLLRGRCNLRMGLGQQALTDADDALELTDRDAHADALYSVGDLEEALVFYQRGRRLRPTISNFRLGIERTEKAIMECVGDPQLTLDLEGDLSHFDQFKDTREGEACDHNIELQYSGISSSTASDSKTSPVSRGARLRLSATTVRQLLYYLYLDWAYVNDLVFDIRDMKSFLECRFDKCKRELPWFMRPYRPLLKRPEELGLVKSNFMHTYLKHLTKLIDRDNDDLRFHSALNHATRAVNMIKRYRGYLHQSLLLQLDLQFRIAKSHYMMGDLSTTQDEGYDEAGGDFQNSFRPREGLGNVRANTYNNVHAVCTTHRAYTHTNKDTILLK